MPQAIMDPEDPTGKATVAGIMEIKMEDLVYHHHLAMAHDTHSRLIRLEVTE